MARDLEVIEKIQTFIYNISLESYVKGSNTQPWHESN